MRPKKYKKYPDFIWRIESGELSMNQLALDWERMNKNKFLRMYHASESVCVELFGPHKSKKFVPTWRPLKKVDLRQEAIQKNLQILKERKIQIEKSICRQKLDYNEPEFEFANCVRPAGISL